MVNPFRTWSIQNAVPFVTHFVWRKFMPHHGLLGDQKFHETAEDIRGSAIYGLNDEKLGKIDDVIFDHATGDIKYVVIDTGGWLSTKKFIIAADRIQSSTKHEGDFTCGLTKKQVEAFPTYQESDLSSQEKWRDYEDRYRSKWESGPVMHRAGTDRNITPTTQQLEGNQSSIRAEERAEERASRRPYSNDISGRSFANESAREAAEEDVTAASSSTGRIVPAGSDSVVISSSASGIGPRWDTFQDRLRERRKEVIFGCGTCATESPSDTLRKAS
jgi:sporulation protein YlmC with PRC-barrel domain